MLHTEHQLLFVGTGSFRASHTHQDKLTVSQLCQQNGLHGSLRESRILHGGILPLAKENISAHWALKSAHEASIFPNERQADSVTAAELQQRRRYRHFSKANNGINVQCWNAQFFHISDSDADVLVPAKEIAVRGENIEGIEQFFHSEASTMMPAASCRSRSR